MVKLHVKLAMTVLIAGMILQCHGLSISDLSTTVTADQLDKVLEDNRLSLVIFGDATRDEEALRRSGVVEAIRLLADDKISVKILLVDSKDNEKLNQKHNIEALPEFRLFWKGIPMLPPNLPKLTPTTILRWIKSYIRASSISNLRELTTTTFFEKYKEKHPFIILGLGEKNTVEAKFLEEFSKNPRSTFATYILQEKLAKDVFQAIGLSSTKFNIILINNVGKVIKEYDGDLDYKAMWDFMVDHTKRLGAANIKGKENYIREIASIGQTLAVFTLSEKSYRNLEHGFVKKMRTLSNEFSLNVVYGLNTPKLHDNFEYNDCEKDQDCLFVYKDYLNKNSKSRYKFELPSLEYKTLHHLLLQYKHASPQPYYYSSNYRAPEIDGRFQVISRDNLQSFIDQGKDIFLFMYKYCGTNCHDKLKYMGEAMDELTTVDQAKLIFGVTNVSTNELPDDLTVLSELNFKYRRAGDDSNWVDLPNYSSGYYIAKDLQKHSSFDLRLKEDIEEDLEDLL